LTLCAICNESTYSIHYTTKRAKTTYHRCLSCGFTAKDPADILPDQEEFLLYQQHNNSISDQGYVSFLSDFLHQAALPFARGKSCLDYGSGPEPVLKQILERDHGCAVDIYDKFYAPECVFEGKTYDLITCTEVLEHIRDPLGVFAVFRKAMHELSVLSLMTWFRPASDSEFLQWSYIRDATHIAFYTMDAVQRIADQFDLRIIHSDYSRHVTLMKNGNSTDT
jgi:hypothetical protein